MFVILLILRHTSTIFSALLLPCRSNEKKEYFVLPFYKNDIEVCVPSKPFTLLFTSRLVEVMSKFVQI
jgi:RNA polymerase-interacting CarD/CdnL/TRCF family regulator